MYYTISFFTNNETSVIYYNNVTKPDDALAYIKANYPWYEKAFLYTQQRRKPKGLKVPLAYVAFNFPNQAGWVPAKKK